jgi:hypothetical protein
MIPGSLHVDMYLELVVCEHEVQELPDPDQDDQHHGEQNGHSPELLNTNIFLDRLFTVHKFSSLIHKFPVTVPKCCIALQKYTITVYECSITLYFKEHKIENFFDSDFGICVISLLVMSKY